MVLDGNWSDPATWTPGGGPPGPGDNAYIGLGYPSPGPLARIRDARHDPGRRPVSITNGTLDLDGQTLTSGALYLNTSNAVVNKAGGNVQLGAIAVQGGSTFAIDAADSLTGNVVVAGAASELDFNKALTLYGAIVSIYGGGTLNANDDLAVTDGLIEVNSGGELNAGGDLSAASVKLFRADTSISTANAHLPWTLARWLRLRREQSGRQRPSRLAQSLQRRRLHHRRGRQSDSRHLCQWRRQPPPINKALNLDNDITVGGVGVLDAYDDVSANTAGIYLGSDFHLHGHTFTANSLTLENSGTIHREGGSIQLGSIRVYNGARIPSRPTKASPAALSSRIRVPR